MPTDERGSAGPHEPRSGGGAPSGPRRAKPRTLGPAPLASSPQAARATTSRPERDRPRPGGERPLRATAAGAPAASTRRPGQPGGAVTARVAPAPDGRAADAPRVEDRGPIGTAGRRYLPALDGLRALAVGTVVAYHLGRLDGGFLGVDLFFVISGYLITSLLLVEVRTTGHISLVDFWRRRFRRLLPALLVVLAAVVVAGQAWLPSWRLGGLRVDALATLGYVGNWRFILSGQSYFASGVGPSPLRHAWSLAIEEQFYVLWPLLVVGVLAWGRHRLRLGIGIVAGVGAAASIAAMAVLGGGKDPSRAYYGTDTRAFTILIGVLLAVALAEGRGRRAQRSTSRQRQVMAWASLPALAVGSVFVVVADNQERWMYPAGFVAFGLVAAGLVAGCAADRGPLVRVLSWSPLRWIGQVSYGIYLWSWPTQAFAQAHWQLHGWRLDLAVVAATLAFATVSAQLVEKPFRTGQLLADRPLALRRLVPPVAVAMAVVVILVATAGATKEPDFLNVSDTAASAEALKPAKAPPPSVTLPPTTATTTTIPGATTIPGTPPPTTAPPTLGRPVRVMVSGDSVGWSMAWGLGVGSSPKDTELDDRGLIGCGVMPQADSRWITAAQDEPQTYYPNCVDQPKAEELGLQGRPDAVVFQVGTWEIYDQEFKGLRWRVGTKRYRRFLLGLLQARIDKFEAAGAVTVLPLVPCFGTMAPTLGRERDDPARRAWINGILRQLAKENPHQVVTLDIGKLLCDGQQVRTDLPGIGDPRPDGVHYTTDSARWLWDNYLTSRVVQAVLDKAAADQGAPPSTTAPAGA